MRRKNGLAFLRSMRFGMILLGAIAALSVIGTLITQGQSAAYYEQAYGELAGVIMACGFDHMYGTWYYAALFAALCLNLLLCSVLRLGKLRRAKAALIERAQKAEPQEGLDAKTAETVCRRMGFRPAGEGLYIRRTLGIYGSFVTHAGMLLLVIAAALVFTLEKKQDAYVMIGDTLTLEDGCLVTVNAFSMENEAGQLDYISHLTVTGRDGKAEEMTAMVNHPARFDDHTVYQQSYNYAGVLDVQTADGISDQVLLTAPSFISLNGMSGVQYMQVYGDYTVMGDGQIMPTQSMDMKNPVYLTTVLDGGTQQMRVCLPNESFEVGGVTYTFLPPAAYPGLGVKTQPRWVIPLLYSSFAMLMLGLYLCFFHVPAALCFADGKVRTASGKDAAELIEQFEMNMDESESLNG